jgi:hypothetical protein
VTAAHSSSHVWSFVYHNRLCGIYGQLSNYLF